MKMMLVGLAVLALAISATSTHTCSCGQQPQPQPQPQQPQPQQPWQQPQQPHPQQPHPQQPQPQQPQPQQPWQYPQQPQQPWWQQPQQPQQPWWQYPQQPQLQQPCPWHEQQPPQGGLGGSAPPALTQCAEFLRQQCSPLATPFLLQPPQQISSGNCQALQQQCCQQLRQVEPQHRQHAILALVQPIIMQQQAQQPFGPQGQIAMMMAAQMAQQLTAMCNLYQQQPGSNCGSPFNVAAGGVRS